MAKYDSNGSKTTLWFIIGFIVIVVVGLIVAGIYSSGPASTDTSFVATTAPAVTSADWKTGDVNSPVSVIEYGDYECPACGAYFPIVQDLIKTYGNRVDFVFRNFPLYTIHPDAGIAAQAAEAAGLQGKFWQMHDQLYETQAVWSADATGKVVSDYFNGYAQTLGLDVTKFDSDINSSAVQSKIATDVNGGTSAQIDHTPTFFINLKQIPNPDSEADFASAIDAALNGGSASSTSATVPTVDVNLSSSSTGTVTVTSTQL